MVSRRRMRRMVVVPCFAATLIIIIYFKEAITEAIWSPVVPGQPAVPPMPTTTVTVVVEQLKTIVREPEPPTQDSRRTLKSTRQHLFRSNGLMEVNPDGRHPLFELIERAEAKWEAKVKRQSKTLDEAVAEYVRRYHRPPPKGFDDWWFYCEKHDVQLPDEYDQIHRDLEPFWGMNPVDLRRLQAEHESHLDSYTIGKTAKDEDISILKVSFSYNGPGTPASAHRNQAQEMIDTLKDVQDFLPPFRAVFSPHDNPNLFTDWEVKSQMLRAAGAGKYIDVTHLPSVKLHGWPSACPPDSPARRTPFDLDVPPAPPTKKTFIYDHVKAMDPCQHPTILHHSGQYLAHNQGPIPERVMIPQFSYSSTPLHHDIVPATPINWVDDVAREDDPDFYDKPDDRLLWRGTSTGIWHAREMRWRGQQRVRLVTWANARGGTAAVLPAKANRDERIGEPVDLRVARLNPAMLDIVFAGEPIACAKDVCEIMKSEMPFREMMGLREAGTYKYVGDFDGHGWSSRFKRLMVSRSLIFKATVFPEWFSGRIQEYVHYIPVQLDYSDLYDSLTFFRGDLNGEGAHEDMAEKIATAGRTWAKTFWRREDLTAYMFRLFLEYGRVMSIDRDAMTYKQWD